MAKYDSYGVEYSDDMHKLVSCPETLAGEYVIPEGVTCISEEAFYDCKQLTSIIMPDTLTDIERGAFYGCTGLTCLHIPASVTKIEEFAFAECENLNTVYNHAHVPQPITDELWYDQDEYYAWEQRCRNACTLHVPADALEAYKHAALHDHWWGFDIQPMRLSIDDRIKYDLAERRNGNSITAAKQLAPLAKEGQGFRFSTKGLPTYFTGNRDAKTVFVQLNPGMDTDIADDRWEFETRIFDRDYFANDYIASRINYGRIDRFRYDSFDVKQAAFLYGWIDSGIQFKEGIEWDPIKDKKINKNDEEKAKDREVLAKLRQTSWLYAKEHVLMDKLQLELIPYASRKFEISIKNMYLLDEFVETLMQEIFRVKRSYVIFGSDVFEKIFKRYRNNNQGNTFWIEDLTEKESIVTTNFIKSDGDPWKAALNYKVIMLHYPEKEPQKAIIAHTFPNQALGNAFNIMYEYGRQCYEAFKTHH